MNKVLLTALLFSGLCSEASAQTAAPGVMDFTIKGGPAANQYQIFARPGQSFTGKWGQIEFVYGYTTSCPTGTETMTWATDPALNSTFGVPYTVVTGTGTSTSPTGYTYNVTSLQLGAGSVNNTIAAGTEVLLGTVTAAGSTCPIGLMDFADAGSSGTANTFITVGATGDYWTPTYGNSSFYNGTAGGTSTAGSTASTTGSLAGGTLNSYAWVNAGSPLPVRLVSFDGAAQGCTVVLNWQTADEQGLDNFNIEYCTDGKNYTSVGRIAAKGSIAGGHYTFTIAQPSGKGLYRLRMTYADGSGDYSPVTAVTTLCSTEGGLTLIPNPASDNFTVRGTTEGSMLQLYNSLGQLLITQTAAGSATAFDVHDFPAGMYLLRVMTSSREATTLQVQLVK
ncbi:T9SS type A sorting domain-containing protein [Chitinophagaceae bacterium MMS25-I14]